jgi:hypothetical protein
VLAGHVETELLGHLDVVTKCGIGRGCVDSVRPKALIQRTDLEIRFAVERDLDPSLSRNRRCAFLHS